MQLIKSVSYSQQETLRNIMALHTGAIDADVTFGAGSFYRGLVHGPRWRFDKSPMRWGIIPADVCHLPLKNACLRSVVFDPPFMARTGPGATLKDRFGELVGNIKDLWLFYFLAMREIHRVLVPGGWLIFKCMDGVLSGVNNFTHVEIHNRAKALGFHPVDLFILLARHRMMHPKHKVQRHARKYHSYFWVLQKKPL